MATSGTSLLNMISGFAARSCQRFINYHNGFSYDFDRGGERSVLQKLSILKFKTIFDVGANIGDWSKTASQYFPAATFHTFELSNSTFETLASRLSGACFVNNNCGLSNVCNELIYKDYGARSPVNTLLTTASFHDCNIKPTLMTANVKKGDVYCLERKIDKVDFLKIDVEGAESLVLEGFLNLFRQGAIRIVQFEYGYTNGDVHFLMRDFFEFFGSHGYVIAKVRKGALQFIEFDYSLNDFNSGPNYIAVHSTDSEALSILAN